MATGLLIGSAEYAAQVAATLPDPSEKNYQAPYESKLEVVGVMSMLTTIEPVATPEEIHKCREIDAAIATGELLVPKLTVGYCSELLAAEFDIEMLEALANGEIDLDELELPSLENTVDEYIAMEGVAYDELGVDASVEERFAGQAFKPRSKFTEKLKNGREVYSYFGDGINSRDETQRRPDPRRLLGVRAQSLKIRQAMQSRGQSPTFAHEGLSLAYEHMAMYRDKGQRHLLSGHRIWVGDRTNNPYGDHVRLLSGDGDVVVNPMGIKIGPKSGREHIARLAEALKLDEPGRASFMIRIPLENQAKLEEVVEAIAEHAPNQIQQLDVHGVTVEGQYPGGDPAKIRSVERIVASTRAAYLALGNVGLVLHGLHLEAKGTNEKPECVDHVGQVPNENNRPIVDPLLTLNQLRDTLRRTREYLPGA